MAKLCPSASSTSVSARRVLSAGTQETPDVHCVIKVKRTYFWLYFQANFSTGSDRRGEIQPDSKFFELNRDRIDVCPTLYNRKWEFTSCQETRLFSIRSHQIGFSQDLEQVLLTATP